MNLLGVRALHGPNLWAKVSVLEVLVDCHAWAHATLDDLQGCETRLTAWLPGLAARKVTSSAEHHLQPSGLAAAMLLEVVLELQTVSRTPVHLGQAMATDEPDVYRIVVPYNEVALARACLEAGCRCCLAALNGTAFDPATELAWLADLAKRVCLGPLTGPIVAAAQSRGIPFRRLDEESLVQLGHGARQRKIWKSLTDRTGKVAEWISVDKERTKRLSFRELGVPVPWGRTVTTPDEAWSIAYEIGLPVVVKPCDSDWGMGVSLNLTTREQVLTAFAVAKQHATFVIVERFVGGEQYRLTVVGQRIVAAVRRDSPRLVGDGQHSIAELIALANRDPSRGDAEHLPLAYICPESDTPHVLAEQGFDFTAIPAGGADVRLSRLAHAWAGGSVTDVTDEIHPQVAAQCVFAVQAIGLDIAGVDVVTPDIRRPFDEQGGAIVEVNAEPALWLHFPPLCDVRRPVCEAIVDSLFPGGETGRIPLAVITGKGDNLTIGRLLNRLLRGSHRQIGRAASDGLYLNNLRLTPGRQDNLAGTRALLMNPQVEAAVLGRSLDSIRDDGLEVDHVDVAIVSRIGDERIDSDSVRAARVLIETVAPEGAVVLDVDEPLLDTLAKSVSANLILVAADGDHPQLNSGQGKKCRAVYLRGDDVMLRERDGSERIAGTMDPYWWEAAEFASPTVVLSAVAAAWASHVPIESLRTKLRSIAQEQVLPKLAAPVSANPVLV